METSVEALCNLLAKHKILDAADVRALRQRWLGEAGTDASNVERFCKWLVAGQHLSEFQMGLLAKGAVEQLYFDQYLLQDRIGQGRMAGVYRAVHPTGQQVALKVLPPSRAANAQLLARFQRESRLAIPLNHPQVVRTFQQGITKAGLNYIVMEFLDGESLEEVLKRRKALPPVEAVHVGAQTLEGLHYLFEEGLVHRDMKPGNLMLVPGNEPGQPDTTLRSTVKILDIGLGRALFDEFNAAPLDNIDLTTEGSILGTPSYMAPEQARSAHTADIRSDIYSVGCLLYEMLAGKPPFEEANYMRLIVRHATDTPRPLPQLNPQVSEGLWQVIETMLSKDPAQRYTTPRQGAKALRASIPTPVELPKAAEPTPKMRSFLTSLVIDAAAPAANPVTPAPVINPVARPLADNTTVLPPNPLPADPAPPVKPTTPDNPAEPVKTPPAMAQANTPRNLLATPEAATSEAPMATPAPPTAPPLLQIKGVPITARDLLCAGIGAGALLMLEGIYWLLLRLFGR